MLGRNWNDKRREEKMITQARLLMLCSIFMSNISIAQPYSSAFGFSSEISDNWLIVTREVLSKNPDILDFEMAEIKKADQSLIASVKRMALAGKFELLYYKKSGVDFYDNINLFVDQNKKSNLVNRGAELCASLPADIKQAWNRNDYANVNYCRNSTVYGIDTINYSFDGLGYGTTSYGYYFNTKKSTITMTITCENSICDQVKKDGELIFKNIFFH